MDQPFLKKANFAFFVKRCSNILEKLLERQQTLFLDLFLIKTNDEKNSFF